jgi:hypothetical protein
VYVLSSELDPLARARVEIFRVAMLNSPNDAFNCL